MKVWLSSVLFLGLAGSAVAQNGPVDSSADAASFSAAVESAAGLVLRVPVNAAGEENTDAAEMRVHVTSDSVADMAADQLVNVFENSTISAESAPVASGVVDQSTWGWYGGYRGWGWGHSNYYSYYQPSYYWGGYNYNWNYRYNYYYNNCNYYYYW